MEQKRDAEWYLLLFVMLFAAVAIGWLISTIVIG